VRNARKNLVGNPEGKKLHGKHRSRCNDNIKIDLKKEDGDGVD
jgi:hypothetical protein